MARFEALTGATVSIAIATATSAMIAAFIGELILPARASFISSVG